MGVAGKGLLLRGVAKQQKNEENRFRGGWFFFSEESPNRRTRKLGSDEQLGLVVGLYSPGESPVRAFCSEESPNRRTRKLGSDEQLGLVVVLYSPGKSPVRALLFFRYFFFARKLWKHTRDPKGGCVLGVPLRYRTKQKNEKSRFRRAFWF